MSMTIFEIADATTRIDTVSQWGLIFSEVAVKKTIQYTPSISRDVYSTHGWTICLCLGVPSMVA